ncbi:MAG: hypothetical protein KJ626_06860 [Verrucomicrobia bacterium]|nr:hypothetical protein [Verrucomicrobiota bacterium]
MTQNSQAQSWERIMRFLADDDDLSTEQIHADLKDLGVDVNAFQDRVQESVRKGIQAQWRERAVQEKQSALEKKVGITDLASWPILKVREWLDQAAQGMFGPQARELVAAWHRKKEAAKMTDEELRSLVMDIQSSLEDGKKSNDS